MMFGCVRSIGAIALAVAVCGCSPGAMIDKLPNSVGEPAGTPERPAMPYAFPAVHDMPPPRTDTIMTEQQQVDLQKALEAERAKQEALEKAADAPPAPQPPDPPKKKAAAAKKDGAATKDRAVSAKDGTDTNP